MKLKNNTGFTVLETILILVIVVLVFSLGYILYKNHHNSLVKKNGYFVLKNLGVEFRPSNTLSGITVLPSPVTTGKTAEVYITDTASENAFQACQASAGNNAIPLSQQKQSESFAILAKIPGKYSLGESALVKQFNGFYIAASYPNGIECASGVASQISHWQVESEASYKALISDMKLTAKLV
jgi:hypothetical protein